MTATDVLIVSLQVVLILAELMLMHDITYG
jgi:hypothetical protein